MKYIYIRPVTHVVALTNDIALLGQSTEPYETDDFNAKQKRLLFLGLRFR